MKQFLSNIQPAGILIIILFIKDLIFTFLFIFTLML